MNEFSLRQYDTNEVSRIIRRALKLKRAHGISYQDLVETAREIGLDPQTVDTAIDQDQQATAKEKVRVMRLKRRKMGFYSHLWSYLTVNIGLMLINNFTPGPWWFQWSVLGWGIGLAFHFKATFFSPTKQFSKRRKSGNHRANFMMSSMAKSKELRLSIMSEFASRHYDNNEVNRIIRRALNLKRVHGISYQDLVDIAKEIGLDPQAIETAIEQEQQVTKKEKIRKVWLKRRKVGFYSHLWSYLIVNGALLLINNFTPGPWWFQWSVLGWGIGLAFHFKATFFSPAKKFPKARKSGHHRANFMMCSQ